MMIEIPLQVFYEISYELLGDFIINNTTTEKLDDNSIFEPHIGDYRGGDLIFLVAEVSLTDGQKDLVDFVASGPTIFYICDSNCTEVLFVCYVKIHIIPPFGFMIIVGFALYIFGNVHSKKLLFNCTINGKKRQCVI